MTDDDLRAMVRDAVARHLGRPAAAPARSAGVSQAHATTTHSQPPASPWQQHASHHLYLSLVNVDGSCVIEPSVACDHCGYCKSHGH
jgi:hypothetical protein